jgi:hypothetical protein
MRKVEFEFFTPEEKLPDLVEGYGITRISKNVLIISIHPETKESFYDNAILVDNNGDLFFSIDTEGDGEVPIADVAYWAYVPQIV